MLRDWIVDGVRRSLSVFVAMTVGDSSLSEGLCAERSGVRGAVPTTCSHTIRTKNRRNKTTPPVTNTNKYGRMLIVESEWRMYMPFIILFFQVFRMFEIGGSEHTHFCRSDYKVSPEGTRGAGRARRHRKDAQRHQSLQTCKSEPCRAIRSHLRAWRSPRAHPPGCARMWGKGSPRGCCGRGAPRPVLLEASETGRARAPALPPSALCASPAAPPSVSLALTALSVLGQVGSNAGIVGMTKEHLGLALALNVPVFVVVTKIDMCPANILQGEWRLRPAAVGSGLPPARCGSSWSAAGLPRRIACFPTLCSGLAWVSHQPRVTFSSPAPLWVRAQSRIIPCTCSFWFQMQLTFLLSFFN